MRRNQGGKNVYKFKLRKEPGSDEVQSPSLGLRRMLTILNLNKNQYDIRKKILFSPYIISSRLMSKI